MQRVISETKVPVKIWATDLEAAAEQQVKNLASLPFIHHHVAVMPDAHSGKGSTVGTVIATRGAIIPAAVGVDIGCGMQAIKLPFKIDALGDSLDKLRSSIERSVPVGFRSNNEISDRVKIVIERMHPVFGSLKEGVFNKAAFQLGTLGGGNHFIEICKDLDNNAWVMLHSGSRNIGKSLAEIHINKAKGLMKDYFIDLPDPDLAFLAQNTTEFDRYLHDLHWAQNYAKENRNEMILRVLKDVSYHVYGIEKFPDLPGLSPFVVDCHHNYTNMENHFGANVWVTRKGAVSARNGEFGIIPGSMGTRSYIVKGKGNLESFCSCSHGAGRRMSRAKARATFTQDDLKLQTSGVECRKDVDVIDEIPGAYKPIEEVMNNQSDLVEVVYELKQLMCIKG